MNVESTKVHGMSVQAWDVGGRCNLRALFRHYYKDAEGLVFVVDSNDRERMDEAKDQLDRLFAEDELLGLPVLVYANKQDLPNAMNLVEIEDVLGLRSRYDKRQIFVQPSSANSGCGLKEGFNWLQKHISNQKRAYEKSNATVAK